MLAEKDNGRTVTDARAFSARYVSLPLRPPAPETPFRGPDGEALTLAAFRGEVVLVNLWASWCAPCVRELPSLDRLAAQLAGAPFRVVAVNLDRDADEGLRFLRARGIKRLSFYHDGEWALARALMAQGLPLSVLIDREGRMRGRLAGAAQWDGPAARKAIEEAIAEKTDRLAVPAG
jgi:thiol-disulfide isomerase/thioredoxin